MNKTFNIPQFVFIAVHTYNMNIVKMWSLSTDNPKNTRQYHNRLSEDERNGNIWKELADGRFGREVIKGRAWGGQDKEFSEEGAVRPVERIGFKDMELRGWEREGTHGERKGWKV